MGRICDDFARNASVPPDRGHDVEASLHVVADGGGAEVCVLDPGVMAQLCGAGPRLEALLPARGRLAFEQQRKPFAMLETSGFRLRLEFLMGPVGPKL